MYIHICAYTYIYMYRYTYIHLYVYSPPPADPFHRDLAPGRRGGAPSTSAHLTTQNTMTTCVPSFVSVPGAGQIQKLLSVGPKDYMPSKTARNLTTTPEGKTLEETSDVLFLQRLWQYVG